LASRRRTTRRIHNPSTEALRNMRETLPMTTGMSGCHAVYPQQEAHTAPTGDASHGQSRLHGSSSLRHRGVIRHGVTFRNQNTSDRRGIRTAAMATSSPATGGVTHLRSAPLRARIANHLHTCERAGGHGDRVVGRGGRLQPADRRSGTRSGSQQLASCT